MFTETIKVKGFFEISRYDSKTGNIIDTYNKQNMIMDIGRNTLASNSAGLTSYAMNKIIFGTKGHVDDNLLQPRSEEEGFVPTVSQLFSQSTNDFHYSISFSDIASGGLATVTEDDNGAGSSVKVVQSGSSIMYEVLLHEDAGNGAIGTIGYTEIGMFMGDNLFAMRTFPVRSKDSGVRLKVKWTFVF